MKAGKVMNFRKLAMVIAVAASCAGCVTQTKTLPASPETLGKIKEIEVPKRDAKPTTWVAVGELREAAADNPKLTSQEKNNLREEARNAYQQALKLDPKCIAAHIHLANLYLGQDDPVRAVAVYQQAVQQNPQTAQLWYEKGTIHAQRKEFGPALECLGKAHDLEPQTRIYATQYGLCLALREQPREAVKALASVMNLAEANFYVARMMEQIHQPDQCRQYLQATLAERPGHAGALKLLADLNGTGSARPIATIQRLGCAASQLEIAAITPLLTIGSDTAGTTAACGQTAAAVVAFFHLSPFSGCAL